MLSSLQVVALMQLMHSIIVLRNISTNERLRRRRWLNNVSLAVLFPTRIEFANEVPRGHYCHLKVNLLLNSLRDEHQLKAHFRVSLQSFYQLYHLISLDTNNGWDEEFQMLAFLFWLACGSAYRVVSAAVGIPKSTLCDIVHRMLDRILGTMKNIIKIPEDAAIPAIAYGFSRLAKTRCIDKAVGSIDCTHIKIMPPNEKREDYINHKLFYSVNLQAVCDHRGIFVDVFAGYPGSVHDARILRCSPLYRQNKYPPQGHYLLADSAYPCTAIPLGILPAYKTTNNSTAVEARFNYHLSCGRNVIERAFGQMKTRWRSIFTKTLEVSPVLAPKVAVVCAIMHNVCTLAGDEWEDEGHDASEDTNNLEEHTLPHEERQGLTSAEPLRRQIAAQVSAPEDMVHELNDHDYI